MTKLEDIIRNFSYTATEENFESKLPATAAEIKSLLLNQIDTTSQSYLYKEGNEKVIEFVNELNRAIEEL